MLSLVADYNTTSSSSSEEDQSENDEDQQHSKAKNKQPPAKAHLLLPSANSLLRSGSSKTTTGGEVFSNPFLEAEKLEIDKLQQHVRMVDSENHILQKNGRKICWNNRKGRCRFGNKCKYAHDSDLVEAANDEGEKQARNSKEQKLPAEIKTTISKPPTAFLETHAADLDFSNESTEKVKSRKRPGLGDSIVPGKRVMKTYLHTKKTSS